MESSTPSNPRDERNPKSVKIQSFDLTYSRRKKLPFGGEGLENPNNQDSAPKSGTNTQLDELDILIALRKGSR